MFCLLSVICTSRSLHLHGGGFDSSVALEHWWCSRSVSAFSHPYIPLVYQTIEHRIERSHLHHASNLLSHTSTLTLTIGSLTPISRSVRKVVKHTTIRLDLEYERVMLMCCLQFSTVFSRSYFGGALHDSPCISQSRLLPRLERQSIAIAQVLKGSLITNKSSHDSCRIRVRPGDGAPSGSDGHVLDEIVYQISASGSGLMTCVTKAP